MKSTRDRILQTLLNNPYSTINHLAVAVNINAISVRHHLTNLQVEGLVQANEERHGVGRPRLVYSLTDSGVEKFPTRYLNLTNRLLDQLKTLLPQNEFEKLFTQIANDIASDYPKKNQSTNIEDRLNYLQKAVEQEGFTLEWSKMGPDYMINEISCPFYHIGQIHPEVCAIDQTLISTILSVPVDRVQCILSGDNQCSYIVKTKLELER
jgi:DeoR family suf operon transcriptional repressor